MRTYTFHYNYETLDSDQKNQYKDVDYQNANKVQCRYRPALNKADAGNPFIEALPYPRDFQEIMEDNTKRIYISSPDKIREMTTLQKCSEMSGLRIMRLPFLFHVEMERAFYISLIEGYRKRRLIGDSHQEIFYICDSQEKRTIAMSVADPSTSTDSGTSVLGYSGCGKSAAINMMLQQYPQVIEHTIGPCKCIQVVYLVVSCKPCSNLSALYVAIADQLDIVLGNITNFTYRSQMEKKKGIEAKAQYLIELIRICNIGTIILDEIQNLDFSMNKTNSYGTFLMISNETKMPFTIIGTTEAYASMFKTLKVARRVGEVIDASAYCHDTTFFRKLVNRLFQWQWFSKKVIPDEAMFQSLYTGSKGIIDQIIRLYKCMHIRYFNQLQQIDNYYSRKENKNIISREEERYTGLSLSKRLNSLLSTGELRSPRKVRLTFEYVSQCVIPLPIVDAIFIEETKAEYMEEMVRLLDNIDTMPSTKFHKAYSEAAKKIDDQVGVVRTSSEEQNAFERYYDDEISSDHIRKSLVKDLERCMPNYNINKVMDAVDAVLSKSNASSKTEKELLVECISVLRTKRSDRRNKDLLPTID